MNEYSGIVWTFQALSYLNTENYDLSIIVTDIHP